MKFSVSSAEFLKQLLIASGAINSNPVLPILEDFLFTLEGNMLQIASTNLETSIITSLEVDMEEEGSIAVPAKILLDTLKALPGQPIQFNLNTDNNAIQIISEYGEYKLSGDNAEDFPNIPTNENSTSVNLSSSIIHNAVNNTLFATSSDELRLAMTGVYVHVDYNKVLFVATDAHKLVKYTVGNLNSDNNDSFIVPKKAFHLVNHALSGEGDIEMSFNNANAFFALEETKVICRLVDAKYPDYNAVIPADNPNEMVIGRRDFQNSLKRIAIYANKTTNQVIFSISDGSLTISAQDLDFSNEATEQLNCQYTGEPITIGFNAKFLIEMLSVIHSDEVKLELSTASRAGILLPVDQEEGEQLLMLVMPVMMSH